MKETEFLRLKRSRLGVHDFEPLKVIGRGAFGEVMPRNKFYFRICSNIFAPLGSFYTKHQCQHRVNVAMALAT